MVYTFDTLDLESESSWYCTLVWISFCTRYRSATFSGMCAARRANCRWLPCRRWRGPLCLGFSGRSGSKLWLDPFSCVILFPNKPPWIHGRTKITQRRRLAISARWFLSSVDWQCWQLLGTACVGQDWVSVLGFSSATILTLSKLGFVPSTYSLYRTTIYNHQLSVLIDFTLTPCCLQITALPSWSISQYICGHCFAFVWHWPVRACTGGPEAHAIV